MKAKPFSRDPFGIISDARNKYLEQTGVLPRWIKLSPNAHEALLEELRKRDGKRHSRIFEILGLKVDIDIECDAILSHE